MRIQVKVKLGSLSWWEHDTPSCGHAIAYWSLEHHPQQEIPVIRFQVPVYRSTGRNRVPGTTTYLRCILYTELPIRRKRSRIFVVTASTGMQTSEWWWCQESTIVLMSSWRESKQFVSSFFMLILLHAEWTFLWWNVAFEERQSDNNRTIKHVYHRDNECNLSKKAATSRY